MSSTQRHINDPDTQTLPVGRLRSLTSPIDLEIGRSTGREEMRRHTPGISKARSKHNIGYHWEERLPDIADADPFPNHINEYTQHLHPHNYKPKQKTLSQGLGGAASSSSASPPSLKDPQQQTSYNSSMYIDYTLPSLHQSDQSQTTMTSRTEDISPSPPTDYDPLSSTVPGERNPEALTKVPHIMTSYSPYDYCHPLKVPSDITVMTNGEEEGHDLGQSMPTGYKHQQYQQSQQQNQSPWGDDENVEEDEDNFVGVTRTNTLSRNDSMDSVDGAGMSTNTSGIEAEGESTCDGVDLGGSGRNGQDADDADNLSNSEKRTSHGLRRRVVDISPINNSGDYNNNNGNGSPTSPHPGIRPLISTSGIAIDSLPTATVTGGQDNYDQCDDEIDTDSRDDSNQIDQTNSMTSGGRYAADHSSSRRSNPGMYTLGGAKGVSGTGVHANGANSSATLTSESSGTGGISGRLSGVHSQRSDRQSAPDTPLEGTLHTPHISTFPPLRIPAHTQPTGTLFSSSSSNSIASSPPPPLPGPSPIIVDAVAEGSLDILRRRKSDVFNSLERIQGAVVRKAKSVVQWAEGHRHELTRLGASLLIFFVTLIFVITVNINAHMRFPQQMPPLPDLGHDLLPDLSDPPYVHLPDYIIMLHGICAFTVAFLHRRRFVVLRRTLVIYSMLMLVRAFCILTTSLPEPCAHCRPECKNYRPSGIRDHMTNVFNGVFPATTSCGDYMFSGHTVFMTICSLIVSHYTPPTMQWFQRLHWTATYIGLLSIVATRLHYTIDVAIALILTISFWQFYHAQSEKHLESLIAAYQATQHQQSNGAITYPYTQKSFTRSLPPNNPIFSHGYHPHSLPSSNHTSPSNSQSKSLLTPSETYDRSQAHIRQRSTHPTRPLHQQARSGQQNAYPQEQQHHHQHPQDPLPSASLQPGSPYLANPSNIRSVNDLQPALHTHPLQPPVPAPYIYPQSYPMLYQLATIQQLQQQHQHQQILQQLRALHQSRPEYLQAPEAVIPSTLPAKPIRLSRLLPSAPSPAVTYPYPKLSSNSTSLESKPSTRVPASAPASPVLRSSSVQSSSTTPALPPHQPQLNLIRLPSMSNPAVSPLIQAMSSANASNILRKITPNSNTPTTRPTLQSSRLDILDTNINLGPSVHDGTISPSIPSTLSPANIWPLHGIPNPYVNGLGGSTGSLKRRTSTDPESSSTSIAHPAAPGIITKPADLKPLGARSPESLLISSVSDPQLPPTDNTINNQSSNVLSSTVPTDELISKIEAPGGPAWSMYGLLDFSLPNFLWPVHSSTLSPPSNHPTSGEARPLPIDDSRTYNTDVSSSYMLPPQDMITYLHNHAQMGGYMTYAPYFLSPHLFQPPLHNPGTPPDCSNTTHSESKGSSSSKITASHRHPSSFSTKGTSPIGLAAKDPFTREVFTANSPSHKASEREEGKNMTNNSNPINIITTRAATVADCTDNEDDEVVEPHPNDRLAQLLHVHKMYVRSSHASSEKKEDNVPTTTIPLNETITEGNVNPSSTTRTGPMAQRLRSGRLSPVPAGSSSSSSSSSHPSTSDSEDTNLAASNSRKLRQTPGITTSHTNLQNKHVQTNSNPRSHQSSEHHRQEQSFYQQHMGHPLPSYLRYTLPVHPAILANAYPSSLPTFITSPAPGGTVQRTINLSPSNSTTTTPDPVQGNNAPPSQPADTHQPADVYNWGIEPNYEPVRARSTRLFSGFSF